MPKFEQPVALPPEERKENNKKTNPHLKAELEVIKQLPKEERRSRIQEFKEKVVEQKLGIAEMQAKFTEIIHRESKMPEKDLKNKLETAIDQYAKEYGLDDYQKTISREVIGRFLEKHKAIERASKAFPNDKDFFKILFGREPKGKIKIRTTPAMIYVQCFNLEDYIYLRTQAFVSGEDLSEQEKEIAAMSYGAAIGASKLPSVKGLIVAENSSKAGIKYGGDPGADFFDHEEQHIIKRLFTAEKIHQKMDLGRPMNEEQFREAWEENLRNQREDVADRRVKDEILAYFKGGTPKETIYKVLTEGSEYDYLKKIRERYANPDPKIYERYTKIVEESTAKILGEEYKNMISNGLDAIESLKKMHYSSDQIIGLLINEPLVRWSNLAHRIAEHKHEEQK